MAAVSERTVVAAFDVDGTLTTRDCVVPFLVTVSSLRSLCLGMLRHPIAVAQAIVRRDRDRLKALATSAALRGRPSADVQRFADDFGRNAATDWLRTDTAARLEWHLAQGHTVVLVSASYAVYLDAFGRELGVHGVIATRIDVDPDGRCTGNLDGPNCRGAEKWIRLSTWLRDQGIDREQAEIWAYGDSNGDREMLGKADHPVWVGHRRSVVSATP